MIYSKKKGEILCFDLGYILFADEEGTPTLDFISERTLYNHIANIYDKLGVKNPIEAYTKSLGIGYIDPFL